ncbi:MAG: sulfatase [Draconibacterium sp.]|nr:sulfatase [Draconibacterium sp.]
MKKISLFLLLLTISGFLCAQEQRPNVLFIAVDDLRPELGCYGQTHIKSPSIDKLAESGLTFNRAYCNIPVCGASRASILSGIRPNRTRFLTYHCWQDKDVPGTVSLPMHFKNNGYTTVSLGKIYHHQTDGKGSWNKRWSPKNTNASGWRDYMLDENIQLEIEGKTRGKPYEKADVKDGKYKDGKIANQAIEELKAFKESGEPFFLAVGFLKPHLPFNAPSKYWDLYDADKIKLPEYMQKPKNAPDQCMHTFGELRAYNEIPKEGSVDLDMAKKLIHGYYACVSFTDALIGNVLDALDNLGLAENTIVILWGDHGWHLGEHDLWCKHCNFEKVLRTPVILRAPGQTKNIKTNALVEYVDVYPSLCELAGLEKPFHLQGKSFVPLVENPNQPWKDEIYCRWGKGETVVTMSHTYTEWLDDKTGEMTARMMYDLTKDPEETVNISEDKENQDLVAKLSKKIRKHILERDKIYLVK